MKSALFLMGCLFFVSLMPGTAFGQNLPTDDTTTAEHGEDQSIQQDLLKNRIADANLIFNSIDRTAPKLQMKELTSLVPTTLPPGISYPLSNARTETPKGKIYPSQTERDVVVGVLLTAAFQKILP